MLAKEVYIDVKYYFYNYSHQHLSNFYWWNVILIPTLNGNKKELAQTQNNIIEEILDEKYKGKLLDYLVCNRLKDEVGFLKQNSLITLLKTSDKCYDIVYCAETTIGRYYDRPVPSILHFI